MLPGQRGSISAVHPGADAELTPRQHHARRMVNFCSAMIMESMAGTSYVFGLYSQQLKMTLQLTQSELQYIVSAGQLGLVVGFAGGLFADACGPRNTAVVGGIMIALGYILEWAAITQWLPRPGGITAAATLSALSLVAIAGGILADVASISSNVRHFPRHRGAVTGALKSLLGLSASLVAQVYTAFYAPHGGIDFLLFLGLAGGTVFILGGLWLNAPSGAGTAAAPDTPALRGGSTAPAQGAPAPQKTHSSTASR